MAKKTDKSDSHEPDRCGTSQSNTNANTPGIEIDEQPSNGSGRLPNGGQSDQNSPKEPTHIGRTQSTTNSQ